MRKTLGVWKTTIIGGVFFMVPFAVVVFLIGQLAYVISLVAQPFKSYVGWTIGGISLTIILATVLLVVICYAAGLAAQRSLGARFTEKIERYLLMLFPRYAVIKDQMASNIGGQIRAPQMKPVMVTFDDAARMGFEVERSVAGAVTVYMPGAPDPWQGYVVHVPAERVAPLAVEFGKAVEMCEMMGRQAGNIVDGATNTKVGA